MPVASTGGAAVGEPCDLSPRHGAKSYAGILSYLVTLHSDSRQRADALPAHISSQMNQLRCPAVSEYRVAWCGAAPKLRRRDHRAAQRGVVSACFTRSGLAEIDHGVRF